MVDTWLSRPARPPSPRNTGQCRAAGAPSGTPCDRQARLDMESWTYPLLQRGSSSSSTSTGSWLGQCAGSAADTPGTSQSTIQTPSTFIFLIRACTFSCHLNWPDFCFAADYFPRSTENMWLFGGPNSFNTRVSKQFVKSKINDGPNCSQYYYFRSVPRASKDGL